MEIPEGRIAWDWGKVTLSYVVAFAVCFVGCIAMVHMEVNFGRQVAFSTIAAIGCCSMHYTGKHSELLSNIQRTLNIIIQEYGLLHFIPKLRPLTIRDILISCHS